MKNPLSILLQALAVILVSTLSANGGVTALRGMSGGKVVLVVSGVFEADQDLRPLLDAFYDWRAASITFNSEGGDIYSAMALGRHIRTRGIVTSQSDDLQCASTCLLAFVGGISRYAELGSIEVDRTSFGEAQANGGISPERRAEVDSYLTSMGVDPSLRELASSYAASGSGRLLATELSYFGVALSTSLAKVTIDADVAQEATATARVIPAALTGIVRHAGGSVALTDGPSEGATLIATLANTTRLAVTGRESDWFKVRVVGGGHGYVPMAAIKVDQWVDVEADQMFIQIASFSSEERSLEFAKASLLPAAVYLASDGSFPVALDQTVPEFAAARTISTLIAAMVVPADAFQTYGNPYVAKVCCAGDEGAANNVGTRSHQKRSVAVADPAALAGAQSLLLEASDSGTMGAVPFSGTVEWSKGTDGTGLPTLMGRANIPARNLAVDLVIRRNSDATLEASHLVEVNFRVTDSFIGGSIAGMPGVLLKNEELVQGTPLVGASARVAGNSFLFALSASPADMTANSNLLISSKWMDLALIYATGKRAIITLEKDGPADEMFTDVVTEWNGTVVDTKAGSTATSTEEALQKALEEFNRPMDIGIGD